MKRNVVLFLIGFVLLNLTWVYWSWGDVNEANVSPIRLDITQVTLYPKGAKLSGAVPLNLKIGDTMLVLEGIPDRIEEASIEIFSEADLIFSDISFAQKKVTNLTASTQNIWQDSLQRFQDSLQLTQYTIDALRKEEDMLLNQKNISLQENKPVAEQMKEIGNFIRSRFLEIQTEKNKLQRKQQLFEEQISQSENKIKQSRKQTNPTNGQIALKITSSKAQNTKIFISFLVKEASWKPLYEAKAKIDQPTLQWKFQAQISQQTGLDWKDVKLTLSTASPEMADKMPENLPIEVSLDTTQISTPVNENIVQAAQDSTEKKLTDSTLSQNKTLPKDSIRIQPDTTQNSYAMEITMEKSWTIFSSESRIISIATHNFPVNFSFKALPQLSQNVFVSAQVANWKSYNFPDGELSLYASGAFLGKYSLAFADIAEDTLRLEMGKDRKFQISHTQISQDSSENSQIVRRVTYQFKILNPYKKVSVVEVEANFPISKDNQISISLDEAEKADQDKEQGKVNWKIALNPDENRTLVLKYTIQFPKDEKLKFKKKRIEM